MRRRPSDPMVDLLARQVDSLKKDALEAGGDVPAGRIEALIRLQRLVEIDRATRPPTAPRRWPLVAMFGLTLAVTSLLLFLRVRETEIDLDLLVSEIAFTLPAEQVLTHTMSVVTLGAAGLRGVRLPLSEDRQAAANAASQGEVSAVRLSVKPLERPSGSIDVATVVAPKDTGVRISHTDRARYRLSLGAPPTSELRLRVDVNGAVDVGRPGAPPTRLDLRSPRGIALESGPNEIDLDLYFSRLPAGPFASPLRLRGLRLSRVEELNRLNGTLVQHLSTVLSGTVYFESLGGQEWKLRPGERLAFGSSEGEIRKLDLRDDGIGVRFSGRVRDMAVGSEASRRSMMPTWLEWLRARHSLSLFWGTAVYLFGLFLVALRWWRSPASPA